MLRHKSSDLAVIITLTVIATVFIYYGYGNTAFRAILALPLVLFLPGYAALAAINPRTTLRRPEFIMLSVGLSLALTALLGLFLNWTPSGLQTRSWAVALGTITLIASLIGLTRRREILLAPSTPFSIGLDFTQQMVLGLAVIIAVAALIIARQGALQQPTTPFTQLWLLPPDESATVQIGILSQENQPLTYRLRLLNDQLILNEWTEITLQPGQKWETTFELPATLDTSIPLKTLLYRQDAPNEIYRQTLIWLTP